MHKKIITLFMIFIISFSIISTVSVNTHDTEKGGGITCQQTIL
jgi:hypothetical protein